MLVAVTSSTRSRQCVLALAGGVMWALVGACGGDVAGGDPTLPRVTQLQLSVGSQVVEIDRNGTVTGGPVVIRAGVDVDLDATFLMQSGLPDPRVTAAAYQVNVVLQGGTAVITFERSDVDPFAGIVRCNFANTSGVLLVSLHHVEEQKDYWGPFELQVLVIP